MHEKPWKILYSKKVFLFLVLCVLILLGCVTVIGVTGIFKLPELKPTITFMSEGITDSHNPENTCSFHSLSAKEALEFESLREVIFWPESQLPVDSSLNYSSNPTRSTFIVVPKSSGGSWHVGDELQVLIQIYDFYGRPKRSGGDVLLARLHSPALEAGVAGTVLDRQNGSYTAFFPLLWKGTAYVEVTMEHPSEAVTILKKLEQEQPDRVYFQSVFLSGSVRKTTTCNVCLHAAKEDLCNYTDIRTGEPWFCYKPKGMSCDARRTHSKGSIKPQLKPGEDLFFQKGVNLKVKIPSLGPNKITVLQKLKGISQSIVYSKPSGYYYQGAWRALDGTNVRDFNNPTKMTNCLKGKAVHLYGDSTIRQFSKFLNITLPGLKIIDLKKSTRSGPVLALDFANNILLTWRCHGNPILFTPMPAIDVHYIANELDDMVGGPDTVVVIGLWSHFSAFPIEVYVRRLLNIRKAVVQLLLRSPDTLVIIRTANPKTTSPFEALTLSNWYSLQRDKVLRAVFKGLKVRFLDAWEMVLAHHLPNSLHPQEPIVKNMINVILSNICP